MKDGRPWKIALWLNVTKLSNSHVKIRDFLWIRRRLEKTKMSEGGNKYEIDFIHDPQSHAPACRKFQLLLMENGQPVNLM